MLVRADGAGHSHQLLDWLTGQRVQYSVGWTLPSDAGMLIEEIPDRGLVKIAKPVGVVAALIPTTGPDAKLVEPTAEQRRPALDGAH